LRADNAGGDAAGHNQEIAFGLNASLAVSAAAKR